MFMFATKDVPRSRVISFYVLLCILVVIGPLALMTLPSYIGDAVWMTALIALILLPVILAELVRAPAKTVAPTSVKTTLTSTLAPEAVFAKLNASNFARCKLHDADVGRRVIVLKSRMWGSSYGFFYPIFIRVDGAGSSIEVGILPRTMQHDSTITHWHEICVAEVNETLAA